jgi:hypothetical protein
MVPSALPLPNSLLKLLLLLMLLPASAESVALAAGCCMLV